MQDRNRERHSDRVLGESVTFRFHDNPVAERNRCAGRKREGDNGLDNSGCSIAEVRRAGLRRAPEARKNLSPRREPWDIGRMSIEPRQGRNNALRWRSPGLRRPLRGSRLLSRSTHGLRRGLRLFRASGALRYRTGQVPFCWLPLRGMLGPLRRSRQIETSSLPLTVLIRGWDDFRIFDHLATADSSAT